jgi:molecular chaperone DnaJ
MSTKRDYYEVLGLTRQADSREIKKAYRKMAMENHPDRNPDDATAEERFKEAAEAYEVLSDSEKREIYDRYGHDGLSRTGFSGFSGFEDIFSSFGDVFGDIFGFGGQQASGPRRGRDLGLELDLSFEEACFGCQKTVELPRDVSCAHCDGNGAEPGSEPVVCRACNGQGQVVINQGLLVIRTDCQTCRGAGRVIENLCSQCGGRGQTRQVDEVQVNVPPGVDTGSRIRKPGYGLPGRSGGPQGDLIILVRAGEHELFERDDTDIHAPVSIDFTMAALGGSLTVPTIHGDHALDIPTSTQPNQVLTIDGQGVPRLSSDRRGDHYAHIRVQIPTQLSKKQKKLLQELAELVGDSS